MESAVDGGPGGGAEAGSIFTRILEQRARPDDETHIVHRGAEVFAILNGFPYTSGHLLVMPYREVGGARGPLGRRGQPSCGPRSRTRVGAVKAAYRPEGVNVGLNLGAAAGAGVTGHLHVHVLPRWNADTNFMTSVAEARVLPEDLATTWRRVRAAWPD